MEVDFYSSGSLILSFLAKEFSSWDDLGIEVSLILCFCLSQAHAMILQLDRRSGSKGERHTHFLKEPTQIGAWTISSVTLRDLVTQVDLANTNKCLGRICESLVTGLQLLTPLHCEAKRSTNASGILILITIVTFLMSLRYYSSSLYTFSCFKKPPFQARPLKQIGHEQSLNWAAFSFTFLLCCLVILVYALDRSVLSL